MFRNLQSSRNDADGGRLLWLCPHGLTLPILVSLTGLVHRGGLKSREDPLWRMQLDLVLKVRDITSLEKYKFEEHYRQHLFVTDLQSYT